jgi:hypothetical protein
VSIYYHGGKAGLAEGDLLVPSDPQVEDGCPVCSARSEGEPFTVLQMRAWALSMGERGRPLLKSLEGAPSDGLVDPPTTREAVYITSSVQYATWYAARSRGDLYRVEPLGELAPSPEDHFPTWTVDRARVIQVLRRGVFLQRRDRRRLEREWKKADRRHWPVA